MSTIKLFKKQAKDEVNKTASYITLHIVIQ